jgi:predicted permease
VEILLISTVIAGVLHSNGTTQGFNDDIIFAFTAPFVRFLLFQKNKSLKKKILFLWNYLGLLVIACLIFLFLTTIYFPNNYRRNGFNL